MWTSILEQSRGNVAASLKEYIINLNRFVDMLEKDDFKSINAEMVKINNNLE